MTRRPHFALLLVAALCAPAPALASPYMILPSGGIIHPVSQPLPVQWAGITASGQVKVTLEARKAPPQPGLATVTLATHQPNSGNYTVPVSALKPLCASLPTSLQPFTQRVPVSQMSIVIVVRSYNNYHGHDRAESQPFKLKCPLDRNDLTATEAPISVQHGNLMMIGAGNLAIEKRVVNNASVPPPGVPFAVAVECAPGGPNSVVTLASPADLRKVVSNIPAGKSCKITERPPQVPVDLVRRGCSWTTSYPNGDTAAIAEGATAALTVVNTWACKP